MDQDSRKLIKEIASILTHRKLSLSLAESCTGGALAHCITDLPGASRFFELSVVSYSEGSKKSVLGLSSSFLKKHGTVSEETAVAMAKAVKKLGKTRVSLAVTGVAGPDAVEGKEVGLVYLAVGYKDITESKGFRFSGSRRKIKSQAVTEALAFLRRVLHVWE